MTDFTAQFRKATDVRKAQRYLSRRSIIAKIDDTALHILVPKRIGGARLAQQMMQAGFVFLVRLPAAGAGVTVDHVDDTVQALEHRRHLIMTAPTKRQATRAIKDAIAYKRIPDDTDYMGFRYGTGYTADYGLYWSKRGLCARFRRRNDGSWYLTSTDEIDATSHMARTLVAWSPI